MCVVVIGYDTVCATPISNKCLIAAINFSFVVVNGDVRITFTPRARWFGLWKECAFYLLFWSSGHRARS